MLSTTTSRDCGKVLAPVIILLTFWVGAHSATVDEGARRAAATNRRIWVFLSDKGPVGRLDGSAPALSPKTAVRIRLRGASVDPVSERAIHAPYRERLEDAGVVVKNEIRWLNAVTGWAHPDDLEMIAALPFVDSLKPVVTYRRADPPDFDQAMSMPQSSGAAADVFDYGNSRPAIALLNVQHLHAAGLTGRGVRIGFLDTGYSLGIRVFACLDIRGTRDFINGDEDVGDDEASQMRHGTGTLSLCGGFHEGELVGTAPAAEYVLAKTELVEQEIEIEEDNWVAGLEWLDSMGCDIVSSSLGYTTFDSVTGYFEGDYDGNTAISTIAADLAAARGMLVVNAAGNAGCGDGIGTIIVPADGDSVLTVGASNFEGERASFSSCGPTDDGRIKPDVIAPGQNVWTALPNTGRYQPGTGTSFATPLVSGICALMLEQEPHLTPFDLITRLRETADKAFKPLPSYGWGLADALAAAGLDSSGIIPSRQFECSLSNGHVELWPNPASSETAITLVNGQRTSGVFHIFTVSGGHVYDGIISFGRGEWAGNTQDGRIAAPGIYLVHVRTESVSEVVKLAWLPRNQSLPFDH